MYIFYAYFICKNVPQTHLSHFYIEFRDKNHIFIIYYVSASKKRSSLPLAALYC